MRMTNSHHCNAVCGTNQPYISMLAFLSLDIKTFVDLLIGAIKLLKYEILKYK